MRASIFLAMSLALCAGASAAPVTYEVDKNHTHPAFEADHFGGLSVWRGIFNAESGRIVLDREANSGTVEVVIDTSSVLTGVPDLDKHLKTADFLEVAKYPQAIYKGKLARFKDGSPGEVQGELTLRGVTRPVTLTIRSFRCQPHPMMKGKEVCGADAHTTINRDDFGVSWGKNMGFDMKVVLNIQIEATAAAK
ncbi:MAG TPA: YceI family protein [Steroidobacteraceae bacterium]|jgi:polyisoprenoid-binding protein YceI|nr:YceI family protein [Steroidobacteraceae bacterium]